MNKDWFKTIERYLIRLLSLSLVCLVIAQGLLSHDEWRFYLSWAERMEGRELSLPALTVEENEPGDEYPPGEGAFYIRLEDHEALPRAVVMVNGGQRCSMEGREQLIEVKAGDIVGLDTSFYYYPIYFTVEQPSAGLAWPQAGQRFSSENGLALIGEVMVK